jgi:hypothetical protein
MFPFNSPGICKLLDATKLPFWWRLGWLKQKINQTGHLTPYRIAPAKMLRVT